MYVPAGVQLDFPLQSYFRLNAKGAGQFEHTLIIVEDDASLHLSLIHIYSRAVAFDTTARCSKQR